MLGGLTAGAAGLALGLPRRASAAAPLNVVATTAMIADAARAIGGELVDVTTLMGPGVDPHAYRQTRSDVAAMASADLVLWNGLYLEAQLEDFLASLSERVPVVAVAEALPVDQRIGHDDYADRFDPHLWIVPELWATAVGAVREALTRGFDGSFPTMAEVLGEAHFAYGQEIEAMGAYAAQVLATVPEEARVLITAHDAFNYFGRAYGYEVVGIQGISTESEAGLKRIDDLVAMLVERGVGAVFAESSVSERNVQALIEGAAAQGHEVRLGGALFSDAMGEPGSYEGTYIGMIDHNATTIARALGGEAPARGMHGRLGGEG
ncbi:MAG: zinc ABC transporter substrate-binding protein [Pseudomonadota bacterium]